jgi:hypothetical protein
MDALAKLTDLYTQRDNLNNQIDQIEKLLGADPAEVKVKRHRGPNKPKEPPANQL